MQYLKRDSNTGGSCDICENFLKKNLRTVASQSRLLRWVKVNKILKGLLNNSLEKCGKGQKQPQEVFYEKSFP